MDTENDEVIQLPRQMYTVSTASRIFSESQQRGNAPSSLDIPFLLSNYIEHRLVKALETLMTYTALRDEGKEEVELLKQALMLEKNAKTKTKSKCSVCFDELVDCNITLLPACCHFFHFTCLTSWLDVSSTCPVCRSESHYNEMRKITAEQANIFEAMSQKERKKIVQIFL
jgi:hypothetical protein